MSNEQSSKSDKQNKLIKKEKIDNLMIEQQKTTWKSLIKELFSSKEAWVMMLGTLVCLLGYFSYIVTDTIDFDSENKIFKTYEIDINVPRTTYDHGKEVKEIIPSKAMYTPDKIVNIVVQGLVFFFGAIIVASVLRIKFWKLGLGLGDFKHWVPITALFLIIILPVIYYFAHDDSFIAAYPSDSYARFSHAVFFAVTFAFLIYFIGWEFIFRGFFLFSLQKKLGNAAAIAIQMIPFAAMHINKPPIEAISSIGGGVILGLLVLRVRSFWPCVIIHWVVHTAINYFVCSLHYW